MTRRGSMDSYGRYWIFFVIVAVGLTLSWGQIGRKAQQVFDDDKLVVLHTEPDCQPRIEPCAAIGSDRALVVGPDGDGLGIRQTGFDVTRMQAFEAVFLDAYGEPTATASLRIGRGPWAIDVIPQATRSLRLELLDDAESTVAEFSLATAASAD